MNRRAFARGAGAVCVAAGASRFAIAQTSVFPSRPIVLVVGFAPGGGTDMIARLIAPKMSEVLGQPVIVENRAGASGTLAAAAVARASPDGHTLLMGHISSNAMVPPVMRGVPYAPARDFSAIGLVGTVPQVLVVPASSPARDLDGFVALLRARPGQLNYASSGIGTQQHLAAELFRQATGTDMVHVPYRGSGQAVNDLLAGGVDANFDTLPTVLPHIQSGALRALGVTTLAPVPALQGVPSIGARVAPGFDVSTWYMLLAPARTPELVIARLSAALRAALEAQDLRERFAALGTDVGIGSPADATLFLAAEVERWAVVARDANIRPE
jgi:tripartite-type tricarboxylate transporter receptor subunit TctC